MIMNVINPSQRINGILLLNKGSGITSNKALQTAKKLLGAQKAGHTGSLDPLATGMLPLCFGEATKVCQFLLDADKCYQTTGLLGIKTNTSDSTGEIIAQKNSFTISKLQLMTILEKYKGLIEQVPSMFSALKHHGTPLYRFAREGIEIERKERKVLIKELQLDVFDGKKFSLTILCSKGTYIRNLVEDIGDALGVGAHVIKLHRLYSCGFENSPMYSLDELESMSLNKRIACLIPMDKAIDYLEQVTLLDEEVIAIRQGRVVVPQYNEMKQTKDEVFLRNNCVRLYDAKIQFIGIGERNINGDLKAKRLLSFGL